MTSKLLVMQPTRMRNTMRSPWTRRIVLTLLALCAIAYCPGFAPAEVLTKHLPAHFPGDAKLQAMAEAFSESSATVGDIELESSPSSGPFEGAFSHFGRLSEVPKDHKRMTIVAAWNNADFPDYLRHFFYTIQLNADVLDLLVINRKYNESAGCMNFEEHGVDITWGGNVKVQCMTDVEWKRRYVDFLCSEEYGWDCTPEQYKEVQKEYQKRDDELNWTWRPLRGLVFRDLFQTNTPFWAWMDLDMFVGNFAYYPFNFLSKVSIMSGSHRPASRLFMAGQLTAFNLEDKALGSAWKKFPYMKTADHFTKYLDGRMPERSEEVLWSHYYMRTDSDLPGSDLSYIQYQGLHGDDFFDNRWLPKNATETYVISGRDILLMPASFTRKQIEDAVLRDRAAGPDDLGGLGWTAGIDASKVLLGQTTLSSEKALEVAVQDARNAGNPAQVHRGLVEIKAIQTQCGESTPRQMRVCVDADPAMVSKPPTMRATLIRLKDQAPGQVFRRLEPVDTTTAVSRKLVKHHFKLKKRKWFKFPPFEITDEMIFVYNSDSATVFKMGASRDQDLFHLSRHQK